MINPVIGETELALSDGRKFTIVFAASALIHAEATYGKPTAEIMAEAGKGFLSATTALLYGALQRHHPEIGHEEAADIALREGMAVRVSIDRAAKLAFPDAPKAPEDRKGPNPPGKNSGASGVKQASTRKSSSPRRRARSS